MGGNLFNRVTWWKGDRYRTHEPPVWQGGNDPAIILSPKIEHYSYYFEEDVKFKDKWYGGEVLCKSLEFLLEAKEDLCRTLEIPVRSQQD